MLSNYNIYNILNVDIPASLYNLINIIMLFQYHILTQKNAYQAMVFIRYKKLTF